MRWPQVRAALARKGWRVHHLARELGVTPSLAWAWLYGREEMPPPARRHTERLLQLPPNTLN